MQINREQFLEDGYVILRNVIPPNQLAELRQAHEVLLERQKGIWARQRKPTDPPGGVWETSAQPRLNLSAMADQIDAQTASAVEIWLHENMHGVSSQLLGVENAGVTEMMVMCSPMHDHGVGDHPGWHRDFYPPHAAPLQGYADDILENGPRYVQWNLPLYDDSVLWVIPGSHIRFNSTAENAAMTKDSRVPLPGAVQVHLAAGDGVAYILPILHWGSVYNATIRRTIHGGFSMFCHYPDLAYLQHLSPAAQAQFTRWNQRSMQTLNQIEAIMRAAIAKDGAAYLAGLDKLHPGRGENGKRLSTIFLSKSAKRIHHLKSSDFDRLSAQERAWAIHIHPMTLQWGKPLADRFSTEEADSLWACFKLVDDALKAAEDQWLPGFQGEQTRYYFEQIPAQFSVNGWIAGW